ncbi:MAG: tryptophan synthase subunit alpha [Promicromonosporaceae bacterium]|nr:tryptophan synthase subunit alpha [Promicromonosporaceae bacterium]
MTSQTAAKLERLAAEGRPALIGYLPVGFPSVEGSIEAAKTMVDAGVDIVELGVPYSDPVMDGPVIQRATEVALKGGTRVRDAFTVIEAIGAHAPQVPVLLMSYYNPVLRYGVDAFARDLAAAGGAGLITPDLIPDEGGPWIEAAKTHDLDRVFLVAPSSTPDRLALTAAAARGFVYAASHMGVTGARDEIDLAARTLVDNTRAAGADHVCLGLGITTADHAAAVGAYADGVIVGSAFVNALSVDADWASRLDALQAVAGHLADGVARARRKVL